MVGSSILSASSELGNRLLSANTNNSAYWNSTHELTAERELLNALVGTMLRVAVFKLSIKAEFGDSFLISDACDYQDVTIKSVV